MVSHWSSVCLCPYVHRSAVCSFFHFQTITWVNTNGFSPDIVCAFVLLRSGLGLLMDKFLQFLIKSSVHYIIGAGYYCFTFLFFCLTEIVLDRILPWMRWRLWLLGCYTGLYCLVIYSLLKLLHWWLVGRCTLLLNYSCLHRDVGQGYTKI